MQNSIKCKDLDDNFVTIRYDEYPECPICKNKIKPVLKYATFLDYPNSSLEEASFTTFNLCPSCGHSFIVEYFADCQHDYDEDLYAQGFTLVGPKNDEFVGHKFDDCINKISPEFVSIYNQAEKAESLELPDICGMAYRKALEFLVKDYAISTSSPDSADIIKKMPLGKCITQYITDPTIQSLATSAAWLGNDETHYVKKHIDKTIKNLKHFINATQYFICMTEVSKEAFEFIHK